MATEKILIFDEAGNAKRMKVRIARFLDNEPVTASDKENIRTTLNVDGSQSGTFTTPLSVTSASDSSFSGGGNVTVSGGVTTLNNSGDNALRVESTNGNAMYVNVVGSAQNYIFDVRDDGTSKFRVDGSGRVGIGSAPAINLGNGLSVDGGSGYVNLNLVKGSSGTGHAVDFSDENGALQFRVGTNFSSGGNNLIFARGTGSTIAWKIDSATGNLVANSTGIDFGSGASTTISDYEEGTATVAFSSGGGSVTIKSANNTIFYTKVGNLVHIHGEVVVDSVSSPTGELEITGLPYASANVANNRSNISLHSAALASATDLAAFVENNSSKITIRITGGTGSGTTGATKVQANSNFVIGGTYTTA